MKSSLLSLVLLSLLLSACSASQEETPVEDSSAETAQVELASDSEPLMLEASFMSDNQTFAYTFNYDGNLLKMMDSQFEGSSEYGPNFKVEGGPEITGYTAWLADLDMVPELAATQVIGRYKAYRYSVPDDDCSVEKIVVQAEQEGLVLQLRVCAGDDAAAGTAALESLVEGLELKSL